VKILFAHFQQLKKPLPGHSGRPYESKDNVSIDVFIGWDDDRTRDPLFDVNPVRSLLTIIHESILLKDTFEHFPVEGS